MPLIVALAIGQRAVLDGHAIPEYTAKERSHGWRERDFRDQEQSLTSCAQCVIGEPQIELGLAAPGDTMEERDSEITRVGQRRELPECLGLLLCQHPVGGRLRTGRGCTLERVALGGLVPQYDEPARHQAADDVRRDPPVAKSGEGSAAGIAESASSASRCFAVTPVERA